MKTHRGASRPTGAERYMRCVCGMRAPSAELLRVHQARYCMGGASSEVQRLGVAMGYRPTSPAGLGVERLLELVRL